MPGMDFEIEVKFAFQKRDIHVQLQMGVSFFAENYHYKLQSKSL